MKTRTLLGSLCLILLGTFSCSQDSDIEPISNSTPEPSAVLQESGQQGVIHVSSAQLSALRVSYSQLNTKGIIPNSHVTRSEALSKLSAQLLEILPSYTDLKQGEFASIVVANDKDLQEVWIEEITIYQPKKMDPLALAFAMALVPKSASIDFSTITPNASGEQEKIRVSCDGGKLDGGSVVVDRPRGKWDAIKVGKKIADFISECIDGGGCVHVCKTSLTYTPTY